jgi:EAL domain-containing protein (putative c-di-GMP-specific phosphodiesterase class I)
MSGDLEVTTIAEGVETLQQADDLAEMGCNIVQGYFYSPPLPVEEYEKLLMQNRVQPGK